MAGKPILLQCIVYPRNKTDEPYPATLVGYYYDPTLEIGGGPILGPPDVKPPDPPNVVWPGPGDPDFPAGLPHPEHPIVLPPDLPPDRPPDPPVSTQPVKPNAWNWNDGKDPQYPNAGWYYVYVPGEGDPRPKRK